MLEDAGPGDPAGLCLGAYGKEPVLRPTVLKDGRFYRGRVDLTANI